MEQTSANLFELQVDPISGNHLNAIAGWAKVLSITGFRTR
jgi:hypothetical protein